MKAYRAFWTEYGRECVEAYRSAKDVDEVGSRVIVTLRMALLTSITTIDVSSRCIIRIIANIAFDTVERRFHLHTNIVSENHRRALRETLTVGSFQLSQHTRSR